MGSTHSLHFKLTLLSKGEESGIPGVAVKCVDIRKNTGGEGGFRLLLTLKCESVGSERD